MTRDRDDSVGKRVREFYEELPFNSRTSIDEAAKAVRERTLADSLPDLHRLLEDGALKSVVEIGCGAGWLCNTLAWHYDVDVRGVDFARAALARAEALRDALGNSRLSFDRADLHEYERVPGFDLAVSFGVLHHTASTRRAFEHMTGLVAAGGRIHVGLYHTWGRRPFLDHFRAIVERRGEDAALDRYRELDPARARDETHLRSWFRDQVLHPHETQHTLEEVVGWLDACDFELESTSINRFGPVDDRPRLFALEKECAEISRRALEVEERYYPGFFTVLARRRT